MKKTIRLTEQDINNIVKESVNKILNEISRDTIASARHQAFKKYLGAKNDDDKFLTYKYKKQHDKFADEWGKRYSQGSEMTQKRMDNDYENMIQGKRVYGKNPKSKLDKKTWYNKEED